jgi:hypothetical protein
MARGRPSLRLLDTLVLVPDSGQPIGLIGPYLTVDPSGDIYVADRTNDVVIAFDEGGRERLRFGRHGGGPGELSGASTLAASDSILLVEAYGTRRVVAFDQRTGAPLGFIRYRGDVSAILVRNGSILLATSMTPDSTSVAAADVAALAARGPVTARPRSIRRPSEYHRFPQLGLFESVALGGWADTLAIAFYGLNAIRLVSEDGRRSVDVIVPAKHRAGSDPDSLARYFSSPTAQLADQFRSVSDARLVSRMTDGKILIVHADLRLEDPDNGRSPIIETGYISLVDLASSTACVDEKLEIPGSETVRVAVRNDTLIVVDQVATDDSAKVGVELVRRRYLVSDLKCDFGRSR